MNRRFELHMLMLAAAALVLTLFASTWATGGTPRVAALASAGQMTFVVPGTSDPLDGAGGNALFGLRFPGGTGACPGDSASGPGCLAGGLPFPAADSQ
jgi:hypothetical protein